MKNTQKVKIETKLSNNQSVTRHFNHKSLGADQLLNIEHQVSTRT